MVATRQLRRRQAARRPAGDPGPDPAARRYRPDHRDGHAGRPGYRRRCAPGRHGGRIHQRRRGCPHRQERGRQRAGQPACPRAARTLPAPGPAVPRHRAIQDAGAGLRRHPRRPHLRRRRGRRTGRARTALQRAYLQCARQRHSAGREPATMCWPAIAKSRRRYRAVYVTVHRGITPDSVADVAQILRDAKVPQLFHAGLRGSQERHPDEPGAGRLLYVGLFYAENSSRASSTARGRGN